MAKNQIHALIDMLRDTMVAHNVHDAIAAAALLSLPVLVVLWITNRMRHPERSFLSAVTIAFTGLAVVPFVSLGAAFHSGGDPRRRTLHSRLLHDPILVAIPSSHQEVTPHAVGRWFPRGSFPSFGMKSPGFGPKR